MAGLQGDPQLYNERKSDVTRDREVDEGSLLRGYGMGGLLDCLRLLSTFLTLLLATGRAHLPRTGSIN
jgi:hypothetical protein